MKLPVFTNLKQPVYLLIFLGVGFIFFDVNYYLMSTLPGSRNEACVMGVNLTPLNIFFSIISSLAIALMVSGIIALLARKGGKKVAATSLSGVGFGLGAFTLFCPVCALPALTAFGLSLGLDFFNDFNLIIKILSLILLFGGLILLNKQLDCQRCIYTPANSLRQNSK